MLLIYSKNYIELLLYATLWEFKVSGLKLFPAEWQIQASRQTMTRQCDKESD